MSVGGTRVFGVLVFGVLGPVVAWDGDGREIALRGPGTGPCWPA